MPFSVVNVEKKHMFTNVSSVCDSGYYQEISGVGGWFGS